MKGRMKKITLLCVVLICASCGGASNPVSPSASPIVAPLLCVSGQSNAYKLLPYLGTPNNISYGQEVTGGLTITVQGPSAQGYAVGGQVIDDWREGMPAWIQLQGFLTSSCTAFVWAQGEADDDLKTATYRRDLESLISRVRSKTSASLTVFVVQLAPKYARIRAEQSAACAADRACRFVLTDDLSFPDGTHLDDAGYRILAARIRG
jgi:hypothetical protein